MSEPTVHNTPERRANPRARLQRLAYIRVEPDNGAIVVDATSEGIRFHAVAPVHQNGNVQFSFSLSGNRRVEAAAMLVWADETKKSGGLKFSSVPPEVVEQILNCCSTPIDPPLPERVPVTSPTAAILPRRSEWSEWPEWEEGDGSLLVVQALAAAGKISRAANQRPRRDPEAWNKKLLEQMPVVARPHALPERRPSRRLPMSRTSLTAFLMGVLFSIPILFLTKLVTETMRRPLQIAAPQTQAQLPPTVPAQAQPIPQQHLFQDPLQDLLQDPLQRNLPSQQPLGGLITPPQLAPHQAKSAKSRGPQVTETTRDSAKDRNGLADPGNPNNAGGTEHLDSRPVPGGSSNNNGNSRANGVASTALATDPNDSENSRDKVKTSVFASSTVESESLRPKANDPLSASSQPLVILDKPSPLYTEEARKLAIEGEVLVEVVFSASGQVRVVRVVKGLGHGLDEAAMNAAQRIRFEPALQNGQPVDVPATVHISFQLAF